MSSITKIASLIVVIALVSSAFMAIGGESDGASNNETIDAAGFIDNQPAFFYYAKFVINGFPLTGGSGTKDSPVLGAGLNMDDDTIYMSVTRLDVEKTYFAFIEEKKDGNSVAKMCVKLGTGKLNFTTWFSLSAARGAFVNGEVADYTVREGTFSESPANSDYVFYLTSEVDKTSATATIPGDCITSKTVERPASKSIIFDSRITSNDGSSNNIEDIGKSYGWSASKASDVHYAGKKINQPIGNYLCFFFVSNAATPSFKITQGGNTYSVPAENIVSTSGYGYVAIDLNNLKSAGFDASMDSYGIDMYDGTTVVESYSVEPDNSGSSDNKALLAICAAVAIIAIGGIVVMFMKN